MSRIFRRPMFRKGGPINEGIMTGIVDREMHALSDPDGVGFSNRASELTKRNLDILMQNIQEDKGMDPTTRFLLEFGPSLAEQKPGAGLINALVSASKDPIAGLIKSREAEQKFLRNLKSGATQLAIEQAGKEDILAQEIAGRKELAAMKPGQEDPLYVIALEEEVKNYPGQPQVADRAAKFRAQKSSALREKVGGERYGGVLTFDISDPAQVKANQRALTDLAGRFVYDPFSNTYKKIIVQNGVIGQPKTYTDIESISFEDKGDADTGKITTQKQQTEDMTSGYLRPDKPDVLTPKIKQYKKKIQEQEGIFGATGA